MSTCSDMAVLEASGLHQLESEFCGHETARTIFATKDVLDAISPPFSDDRDGEMHAEFKATIDAFLEGNEITVAEDPYDKPADTMLARVDPVEAGVWDLRIFAPRPGIRCLGCFWHCDVFVALVWDYRENFDGDWPEYIQECLSAWRRLFGDRQPVSGGLDEHLTEYFSV
jgi:hypothetical protein